MQQKFLKVGSLALLQVVIDYYVLYSMCIITAKEKTP